MKQIFLLLYVLSIFLFSGCAMQNSEQTDERLHINNLRQLVTENNASERTIIWQTSEEQKFIVEYKKEQDFSSRTIPAQLHKLQSGTDTFYQYNALLTNLEPAAEYSYRISDGKNSGSWHKICTDNGKTLSALIFPDSQSSDYSSWQNMAQQAFKNNPSADLYINMGDLADNGADYHQWNEWFKGVKTFSADIPLVPVMGNHETYTLDWKTQQPYFYTNLFALPSNGYDNYQNQFYSFDYGPVHFIVLDTQFDELKDFQPQLLADQLAWLKQDLSSHTAPWTIVLQHKDILLYEFKNRPNTSTHFIDIGQIFMPVFEEYNVDLVLTAHLHTYRRRVPLKNFQPDAEGITYILTGIAGNVMYPGLWKESNLDAAAGPDGDTGNYLTLQADENNLTVAAYTADGKKFDEYMMKK